LSEGAKIGVRFEGRELPNIFFHKIPNRAVAENRRFGESEGKKLEVAEKGTDPRSTIIMTLVIINRAGDG